MYCTLDAPVLARSLKPLGRVQALRGPTGQQVHRFGFVFTDMAIEFGDLFDVREAELLRGCRLRMNLSAFPPALVHLVGPGHRRGDRLRGKNPPAWRRSVCGAFVGSLFGCP